MQGYFARKIRPHSDLFEIWRVTDDAAYPLNQTSHPGSTNYWDEKDGLTPWERLQTQSGFVTPDNPDAFRKLRLDGGRFHRRIARPDAHQPCVFPPNPLRDSEDDRYIAQSLRQLDGLVSSLREICITIEPDAANMFAYGHDVRNLLLLSCTAVEMHWRGVATVNNLPVGKGRKDYNTTDYVKLLEPMKLNEYSVRLEDFPWLGTFAPFRSWEHKNPTASLPWYDAYNKTKHDLEGSLKQATLATAFNAVAAVMVLMAAQFGRDFGMNGGIMQMTLVDIPQWPVEDCYCAYYEDRDGPERVPYQFIG